MPHEKRKVLIIDRNQKNIELLSKALETYGFECYAAFDYPGMDNELDKGNFFDIILIDVSGFDVNIWDRCKTIHQLNIPLLILSTKPNAVLQQHGIRYGAKGIISKPVILKEFVQIINSLIVDE